MRGAVERSRAEPNVFANELFAGLPRRYDLLEDVLSMRQNRRWREAMIRAACRDQPQRVLDVATGTAGVALDIAGRTGGHVVGLDVTPQMLREGRRRVLDRGLGHRVHLVTGRAEQLPFEDAAFDALTFTYLLRYVTDPAATVRELSRVVRPGGWIASLEFGVPAPPVWLPAWRFYTRAVLPAAGLLTGGRAWYDVGRFLGPSIESHYRRHPIAAHVAMWHDAGIEQVVTRRMSLGGGLVMWGRRA